jgi:hypothetical protein
MPTAIRATLPSHLSPNLPRKLPYPQNRHDGSALGTPVSFSKDCQFNPQVQKAILRLLERDKYCTDCKKVRECGYWDERAGKLVRTYMHCSKCRLDHPRCLFSKHQRSIPHNNTRVCIGREGSLRLCSHTAIKWPQATSSSFPKCGLNTEGDELLRCHYKSHLTSCRTFP